MRGKLSEKAPEYDFRVELNGSIVSIYPNEIARAWLEENAAIEGWQWLGPTLCIDVRFAGDLIEGMMADGLRKL